MDLTSKELKKINEAMPSPAYVPEGFMYWVDELTRRIINIFTYKNLPDTCNELALRRQLINGTLKNGCSVFVKDNGNIYNVDATPYGVTPYSMYGVYDHFTVANPKVRVSRGELGVDGEIVWNDSLHKGLTDIIERYARMLADEDSTFSKVLYNMRRPNFFNAPDEKTARSIKASLDANELGLDKIVLGKDIISEASILSNAPSAYGNGILTEHIMAKSGIINQFMRELGIPCVDEKKERINEAEIDSQNAGLSIIYDMLNTQREGIARVNELFQLNIEVEISEEWSWIIRQPDKEENNENATEDTMEVETMESLPEEEESETATEDTTEEEEVEQNVSRETLAEEVTEEVVESIVEALEEVIEDEEVVENAES